MSTPNGMTPKIAVRKRHPNHRLVKTDQCYTVEGIARLFGKHRNTVFDWIEHGLRTIDKKRPILIHGGDLKDFLQRRRQQNKRKCRPDEIYCVRCREPKRPAGDMADYLPNAATMGSICGICPTCNSMIYRRVSLAKLGQLCRILSIKLPQRLEHIVDSSRLIVNCELKQEEVDHAQLQSS